LTFFVSVSFFIICPHPPTSGWTKAVQPDFSFQSMEFTFLLAEP
jgi:hypothetical protein